MDEPTLMKGWGKGRGRDQRSASLGVRLGPSGTRGVYDGRAILETHGGLAEGPKEDLRDTGLARGLDSVPSGPRRARGLMSEGAGRGAPRREGRETWVGGRGCREGGWRSVSGRALASRLRPGAYAWRLATVEASARAPSGTRHARQGALVTNQPWSFGLGLALSGASGAGPRPSLRGRPPPARPTSPPAPRLAESQDEPTSPGTASGPAAPEEILTS